jgi:hypothetical protein
MDSCFKWLAGIVLTSFFVIAIGTHSDAFAQGRGRGGGGGSGHGNPSMGNPGGGKPDGIGVDRGIDRSSEKSGGNSDRGRSNASEKSNGRSDAGIEHARLRSENAHRADDDLRKHPEMAKRLHTTANDLRSGYQTALLSNPNLNFGNYVAATRLGANLGRRHPGITRDAILGQLAQGSSVGRSLQNLGLSEHEAKDAQKQAEREIKEARKNN